MSKKSVIARNKRRVAVCKSLSDKRSSLMNIRNDASLPTKVRFSAQLKISSLPADSSEVRIRNRCVLCGRPRSVYRKLLLCRMHLRDLALKGHLPGFIKSSW